MLVVIEEVGRCGIYEKRVPVGVKKSQHNKLVFDRCSVLAIPNVVYVPLLGRHGRNILFMDSGQLDILASLLDFRSHQQCFRGS